MVPQKQRKIIKLRAQTIRVQKTKQVISGILAALKLVISKFFEMFTAKPLDPVPFLSGPLLTFLLLLTLSATSQVTVPKNLYGIKNPGKEIQKRCLSCQQTLASMPPDVHYGTFVHAGKMYFTIDDPEWFYKLFNGKNDGIAFDIIPRDMYACGKKAEVANSWAYRGNLIRPMYLKEMLQHKFRSEEGYLVIEYGDLPKGFDENAIECNLLILKDKYVCHYSNFYDLQGQKWQLLKLPLMLDSLTEQQNRKREILYNKEWKFIIPFEKNKIEYASEDLKPLYDSLSNNDFKIKSVKIIAYSSVEGPLENNIRLQEDRANSIVKALQALQVDTTIPSGIQASENWVEFLQDIEGSSYSSWKTLSKEEIKKKLEDRKTSYDLEKYLKNHRKAIIQLELQKKVHLLETNPEKVKTLFQSDIEQEKIPEALKLQREIFDNIEANKLSDSLVKEMTIPEKPSFGLLLMNKQAFGYNRSITATKQAAENFRKLQQFLPDNTQLRFNLAVLELQLWANGDSAINGNKLGQDIQKLSKRIDQNLYLRMMLNHSIIQCEKFQQARNYPAKDKAIQYIYRTCPGMALSDEDALSLGKFFVAYAKYDWAEALLIPYAKKIDVLEDLIFYYINLTIVKPKVTSTQTYRSIMLNAINRNKARYCKLFDPFGKGGISFQLLENEYLRKTYCENCNK